MTDVITRAGYRVTKTLGDRTYTLRAPSFGEIGALLEEGAGEMPASSVVIYDTLRAALLKKGHEHLVANVDAVEDAVDAMEAARSEWRDGDSKADLIEANVRVRRANRDLARAEELVKDDDGLRAIRLASERSGRRRVISTLVLTLEGWTGEGLPDVPSALTAEFVSTQLPGNDIAALGQIAQELIRPTRVAEGNSGQP